MNRRQLSLTAAPVLALLLLFTGLAPALAADPPSFAGTWVLNTKKGENLGMMSAVKETVKIAQTPQKLTIESSAGFMGTTTRAHGHLRPRRQGRQQRGPDGQPRRHRGEVGRQASSWSRGPSPARSPAARSEKVETRELSADGKTMSVTTTRGTKPPMVMVYERQK